MTFFFHFSVIRCFCFVFIFLFFIGQLILRKISYFSTVHKDSKFNISLFLFFSQRRLFFSSFLCKTFFFLSESSSSREYKLHGTFVNPVGAINIFQNIWFYPAHNLKRLYTFHDTYIFVCTSRRYFPICFWAPKRLTIIFVRFIKRNYRFV